MRALLSVWDKTGLAEFAQGLHDLGWELVSTGQTHAALTKAGIPAISVADVTGFPEILGGRVKTLHPAIHAGILARRDVPGDLSALAEHGIVAIDLVVTNLYPFVSTISGNGAPPVVEGHLSDAIREAVEQIDIGGPAMTRAAAKNFAHIAVVTDPRDYPGTLDHLRAGTLGVAERVRLAQAAFAHTAQYDAYVAAYFSAMAGQKFPDAVSLPLTRASSLTYGENPHQSAALYRLADPRLTGPGLADLVHLSGDDPSYNNLLDLDCAYAIVADFTGVAVSIVKHNNPCGVGVGSSPADAYRRAYAGDPLSAFGGVVACNRIVDGDMARAMSGVLYWVLVAPGYTDEALRILGRRQTRVFSLPVPSTAGMLSAFDWQYRPVTGGFLAQSHDTINADEVTFTAASARKLTDAEENDLRMAWRIVKHVRSNASVFVRDGAVRAVGAGQMSRLDSVVAATRIASRSAQDARTSDAALNQAEGGHVSPLVGSVMATDGFFADPDAVEAACEAGATAIAHPGGGRKDADASAMADRYGIALVTTGFRHFRH